MATMSPASTDSTSSRSSPLKVNTAVTLMPGQVSGTAAWLKRLPSFMHHHVALEDQVDIDPFGPGVGFGEHGDGYVRFSLIENEERTRQALRGIKQMFKNG